MNDCVGNGLRAVLLTAAAAVALTGCTTNTSLRQEGVILYNGGNYGEAQAKFDRAVEMKETDYLSLYWLGRTQLKLGDPVAAQLSLERAQAVRLVDPAVNADILDALAEAYYRQNRPDNLAAFLASAAREPGTSRDFLRQGTYLAKIGDFDGARTALRKGAYFASPGDAQPYMVVADFYHQINDQPNELAALKYAYYVNPKHPGLANRIRALGTVPGPTVAVEPPKPELLR